MTQWNASETMIPSKSQIDRQISSSATNLTSVDNATSSVNITLMNPYIPRENEYISDRISPGLAKPISTTSLNTLTTNRIDAALEKNLETIATEVRRTSSKPSQLTQNDLQLFDTTSSNGHISRETTPDPFYEGSTSNGFPYGQGVWPPTIYPFAHQHPGLYLPYPTVNNGLPPFYPSMIEQHYGPQGLSAFYSQQQAIANRLLQENPSLSDNFSLLTPTREYPNHSSMVNRVLHPHEHQQRNSNITKSSSSLLFEQNLQTINGSLSRLSPDLLSDGDGGGTNDADSIISLDSIKSTSAISMPVVEDGLSDCESSSHDEQQLPPVRSKYTENPSNRPSIIPSHKQQFVKPTPNPPQTQSKLAETRPSATSVSPARSDQYRSSRQKDSDSEEETGTLLSPEQRINAKNQAIRDTATTSKPREVITRIIADPENSSVLIEGVLFRCRYLGSTQLPIEGSPTKVSRMMQAQEAVERIKAPDDEHQPSVEVDLFISTEKIMVLNTDLEDILMDHSLRSISYIADIGDLVVLMAKRRYIQNEDSTEPTAARRVVSINQKMICHVFESEEAQSIAHSIGQAFQVAYVEFLKANGIDDPDLTADIDYQEVLDQQEVAIEELNRFSKKECQKEAIVTKGKNEPLGIVIVESGWGSMLPTVVIANMMPGGPAARGGQLNIGDQVISVNGISMVGLPLSSCQTQIKNMKHLTTVRFVVVACPPVVEVLIRRPDTKYQLGFSVQNGIICSLLRGGIAERGGVRVGHRIIEINGQSVVATTHTRIVNMLSHSIGELRMKTMPTQMYRLLTGQETPIYI